MAGSNETTVNESPVSTPVDAGHPRSNRGRRFVLLVIVPILAIALGAFFYLRGGRYVTTENAYVKSNIIAVSTDVSGRVRAVNTQNNQLVSAGDTLFTLDAEQLLLRLSEARAQMDVVRTEVESHRAEHREVEVSLAEAEARVAYFNKQFQRHNTLKKQGIGSAQAADDALFNLRSAEQRIKVLSEKLKITLAGFGGDAELPVEQHPSWLRAQAQHNQALAQLDKTIVIAPADGIVSNVTLQTGEYVKAGEPVFSLIETARIWVDANLKETQLMHVLEGQRATIEVDAYPGRQWQATVSTIAPATGAQFTLLPPQNATGNWVKVVQRVPVSLTIEQPENAPRLRAGMTVSVRIDTRHQRQAPAFIRRLVEVSSRVGSPTGVN